jgi:hypothetical protein
MFTDMTSITKRSGSQSPLRTRQTSSPPSPPRIHCPVAEFSRSSDINFIPSEVSAHSKCEKPDECSPMRTFSLPVGRASMKPNFIGRKLIPKLISVTFQNIISCSFIRS